MKARLACVGVLGALIPVPVEPAGAQETASVKNGCVATYATPCSYRANGPGAFIADVAGGVFWEISVNGYVVVRGYGMEPRPWTGTFPAAAGDSVSVRLEPALANNLCTPVFRPFPDAPYACAPKTGTVTAMDQ